MRSKAEVLMAERFLRSFGKRALRLYLRFAASLPDRRCRTCAFREIECKGPDGWKGWQTSLYGLAKAARGEAAFVCHLAKKNDQDYRPHARPRFCAGYALLAGRSEFERAIYEAAIDAAAGES